VTANQEGRPSKRTRSIVDTPSASPARPRRDALGNPSDGKGPFMRPTQSAVDVTAPASVAKSVNEPMARLKAIDY